jgi:hypothetical protein
MKRQFLPPILLGLLNLTAACSKTERDHAASNADDPLPKHMNCAVDEATEQELLDLASRILAFEVEQERVNPIADDLVFSRLKEQRRVQLERDEVAIDEVRRRLGQLEAPVVSCLARERWNSPSQSSTTTPGR